MKKFLVIADIFLALMILAGVVFKIAKIPSKSTFSILNQNYSGRIQNIELKTGGNNFNFFNTDNIWMIRYNGKVYPVNQNYLDNLISASFTQFKGEEKKSLYLDNFDLMQDRDVLTFYLQGNAVTEVYFGNINYLTGKICIKSSADSKTFEIQDVFSKFFQTDLNFWVEPSVYASQFTGLDLKSTYMFPRRGPLSEKSFSDNQIFDTIKKEFSTGAVIWTKIFKDSDSSKFYAVQKINVPSYYSEEQKKLLQEIQFEFTISQSTYQKLKEEN